MVTDTTSVRPGRTVLTAVLGGVVGAVVIGYLTGQLLSALGTGETGAWRALGAAILGAAIGTFVGAAVALWLAFRDEPARARRTTVLTTLIGGPLLLVVLALVAEPLEQDWNLPQLWLVVALLASAFLGRWLAVRGARR